MIDPDIIRQLGEAEKAATPGPWSQQGRCVPEVYCDCCAKKEDDANCVALTRNHLRALLDERAKLVAIAEAAEYMHACPTVREDGTCDGCPITETLATWRRTEEEK